MKSAETRISKALSIGCLVLVFLSFGHSAFAQDGSAIKASYVLNPDRVINRIDEKVYGHFFEHIYHSANGGLWGEQV